MTRVWITALLLLLPAVAGAQARFAGVTLRLTATFTDGPLTPWGQLRGRTNESGYVIVSAGATGSTDGPLTLFPNLRTRTDENGYLRVSLASGSVVVPATDCTNQFVQDIATTGAGTCATVVLTSDVSGILPEANGGTGANNTATSGRYLKGDGSNFITSTGSASGTGACAANTWASTLNSDAAPTCTQPASGNLSDNSNLAKLSTVNTFANTNTFLGLRLKGDDATNTIYHATTSIGVGVETAMSFSVGATSGVAANRVFVFSTGGMNAGTNTDPGAGIINATTRYNVGGTNGCTGTPTAATGGIATTCSSPEAFLADITAEVYSRVIASLEARIAALEALLKGSR